MYVWELSENLLYESGDFTPFPARKNLKPGKVRDGIASTVAYKGGDDVAVGGMYIDGPCYICIYGYKVRTYALG
jgi:hypothetical protein